MGNRAIIKPVGEEIGIYLHWDGSTDTVTALLEYCKRCGFRDFGGEKSDSYGLARFCQVAANVIGGSLSIGITAVDESEDAEYLDNGIYVVDGWNIKQRIGPTDGETNIDDSRITELMLTINAAQPIPLDEDYIRSAAILDAAMLAIGDKIYETGREESSGPPCNPILHTVTGFDGGRPIVDDNPNIWLRAPYYKTHS